jgi:ribosomal protein L40E
MADTCPHCDADIAPGDDFCRECGHSLAYQGDNDALFTPTQDDHNSGDICPQCGATHMITTEGGRKLCETCGFLG